MTVNTGSNIDLGKAKLELVEYGYVVLPDLIPRDTALEMAEKLIEVEKRRETPDSQHQDLTSLFNHLQPGARATTGSRSRPFLP